MISAYETLDVLNERVGHAGEALTEARRLALDAQAPYGERRRKENREREEFINGQSRPTPNPAPEEAQGA